MKVGVITRVFTRVITRIIIMLTGTGGQSDNRVVRSFFSLIAGAPAHHLGLGNLGKAASNPLTIVSRLYERATTLTYLHSIIVIIIIITKPKLA